MILLIENLLTISENISGKSNEVYGQMKHAKKPKQGENQIKKGYSKNRTVTFGKNTILKAKASQKYQLDESKKTSKNSPIRSDLS